VFGSGNGVHGVVSEMTKESAVNAVANTILLEEERAEKRIVKAKHRSQKVRARLRAVTMVVQCGVVAEGVKKNSSEHNLKIGKNGNDNANNNRFEWHLSTWLSYKCSEKKWQLGINMEEQSLQYQEQTFHSKLSDGMFSSMYSIEIKQRLALLTDGNA